MTHRAEQIMVAVTAAVTGLTTTDTSVFRDDIRNIDDVDLPALSVRSGSDVRINQYSQSLEDWELTINIEAHAQETSGLGTKLNLIRQEVVVALNADYTLGLAFVIDTNEDDPEEPVLDDGSKPVGHLLMPWVVKYRRSYSDPGA